jgi:hypothetical protein
MLVKNNYLEEECVSFQKNFQDIVNEINDYRKTAFRKDFEKASTKKELIDVILDRLEKKLFYLPINQIDLDELNLNLEIQKKVKGHWEKLVVDFDEVLNNVYEKPNQFIKLVSLMKMIDPGKVEKIVKTINVDKLLKSYQSSLPSYKISKIPTRLLVPFLNDDDFEIVYMGMVFSKEVVEKNYKINDIFNQCLKALEEIEDKEEKVYKSLDILYYSSLFVDNFFEKFGQTGIKEDQIDLDKVIATIQHMSGRTALNVPVKLVIALTNLFPNKCKNIQELLNFDQRVTKLNEKKIENTDDHIKFMEHISLLRVAYGQIKLEDFTD